MEVLNCFWHALLLSLSHQKCKQKIIKHDLQEGFTCQFSIGCKKFIQTIKHIHYRFSIECKTFTFNPKP